MLKGALPLFYYVAKHTWRIFMFYYRGHIRYDGDTGEFFNVKTNRKVGSIRKKGSSGIGYVIVACECKIHYGHRLAWEMAYGEIPEGMQIDHINGIRHDNRIVNLRLATIDDNMRNRAASKRRLPGVTGVTFSKNTPTKPWKVMIWNHNKHINLGYYASFVEACEARIVAEVNLGYNRNHGARKILY